MKKVGAFICNFNGKDWTLKCLESVQKQVFTDYDIHVVDNASTDGSVAAIKEKFGDWVEVFENAENLGGSGGFDRALREGIAKGYKYILLLDNDVELEPHMLERMAYYLDNHADVGQVGARVMQMKKPDLVQDYGVTIDWENFTFINAYSGKKDINALPETLECDHTIACATMLRADALKKSGTMPVDYFIYVDDVDLSHRIVLCGYKVVVMREAVCWHNGGSNRRVTNTFNQYYNLRNGLCFFGKYYKEEKIDRLIKYYLDKIFATAYGSIYKNWPDRMLTELYALVDFIAGKGGKAQAGRIFELGQRTDSPFEKYMKETRDKDILIYMTDNYVKENPVHIFGAVYNLCQIINGKSGHGKFYVSLANCHYDEAEFYKGINGHIEKNAKPDDAKIEFEIVTEKTDAIELVMCEHVKYVTDKNILPQIYVDRYRNALITEDDYKYFANYDMFKKFFYAIFEPMLRQAIETRRSELNGNLKTEG